jgi:hypothetical protein
MTIVLESYTPEFDYAWRLYAKTITRLRTMAINIGLRKEDVYLPLNNGSKETAYQRWKYILKEVKFESGGVDTNILVNAIELYTKDKVEESQRSYQVAMPMMSVFLNVSPRNDRDILILDYIRKAKEMLNDTQRNVQSSELKHNS